MTLSSNGSALTSATANTADMTQLFIVEDAGDGTWYLKNAINQDYAAQTGSRSTAMASTSTPVAYKIVSNEKGETYLQMQSDFPYTIFRCTGVYGPHERDYFLMMKSIKRGFDFSVGFKKQLLTFIYVKDLAQAVMDALEAGPMRKAYFISENQSYTQQQFRKIVLDELGKKVVIPVTCPLWVVKIVCHVAEFIGKLTGKPSTLNPDKFRILKQRNWQCDTSDAQRDFNFSPQHSLKQGVHEAIEWYHQAGWL